MSTPASYRSINDANEVKTIKNLICNNLDKESHQYFTGEVITAIEEKLKKVKGLAAGKTIANDYHIHKLVKLNIKKYRVTRRSKILWVGLPLILMSAIQACSFARQDRYKSLDTVTTSVALYATFASPLLDLYDSKYGNTSLIMSRWLVVSLPLMASSLTDSRTWPNALVGVNLFYFMLIPMIVGQSFEGCSCKNPSSPSERDPYKVSHDTEDELRKVLTDLSKTPFNTLTDKTQISDMEEGSFFSAATAGDDKQHPAAEAAGEDKQHPAAAEPDLSHIFR